jgi:hypothetical protein
MNVNRRGDEDRVRNCRTTTEGPGSGAFADSPNMAGCLHVHADLVLEFVPECKLVNANRR